MNQLRIEVDAQGIAVLTIDVPGRPMNVITPELTRELAESIEQIVADPSIKAAIITSGKTSSFIAGADLKDLVNAYDSGIDAAAGTMISVALSKVFRRLETCGKPIAAAINGLALGGGLELCLACHYRVLSDDPKAVLGLPEVHVGLLPGAGGTQRLPRLIGIPAALPLLLQGKHLAPAEAFKLGIVHALASADEVVANARLWLLGIPTAVQPWEQKDFAIPAGAGPLATHAQQSFVAGNAATLAKTYGNYPAAQAILSCVFEGTQVPIDTGLRIESKYFGKLIAHPVARNLMRTMFVNKGAAEKLAGRPANVPRLTVRKLGVLGAGMMGAAIAHVSARAGIEVILLDSSMELAEAGTQRIATSLAKDIKTGRITQSKAEAVLANVKATAAYAELAGCDLVIEAVFERRDIKADVTKRAEAAIPAAAIFGSNTSTLSITTLARAATRPKQFIGVHFFSPVEKMPLVEVIVGQETDEQTIAQTLDYVAQLKKTPIVVRDSPGFYTSRVFSTFTHEGMRMLLDGIQPALIENAARLAGFPAGPLAVSDEVTLSLQHSVCKQQDADGVAEKYRSEVGRPVIFKMVEELKRTGRKAGAGFYDYPDSAAKSLWPGLWEVFPVKGQQPDVAELKLRFLTIMALEATRCFEEGVVLEPMDADIGSVLGIGYPSWTGGTLSYVDTIGTKAFVNDCEYLAKTCGPRFKPSAWLVARVETGQTFYKYANAA